MGALLNAYYSGDTVLLLLVPFPNAIPVIASDTERSKLFCSWIYFWPMEIRYLINGDWKSPESSVSRPGTAGNQDLITASKLLRY